MVTKPGRSRVALGSHEAQGQWPRGDSEARRWSVMPQERLLGQHTCHVWDVLAGRHLIWDLSCNLFGWANYCNTRRMSHADVMVSMTGYGYFYGFPDMFATFFALISWTQRAPMYKEWTFYIWDPVPYRNSLHWEESAKIT
jgi:hypothetical protein